MTRYPQHYLNSHQTHLKYHSCSASPCLEWCWRELCAPVVQHLRLFLNLSNCVSAHKSFWKKKENKKKDKFVGTSWGSRMLRLLSSTTHTTQLKPAIVAPDAIIANALHLCWLLSSLISALINLIHLATNRPDLYLFIFNVTLFYKCFNNLSSCVQVSWSGTPLWMFAWRECIEMPFGICSFFDSWWVTFMSFL